MNRYLTSTCAAVALVCTASMSLAGGWGGRSDPGSKAIASARAASAAHASASQQQGQIASVVNAPVYNETVQAPSMAAGGCDTSFSLGTDGTNSGVPIPLAIGACWKSGTGKSVDVALAYGALGYEAEGKQILDNTPVARRARRRAGN